MKTTDAHIQNSLGKETTLFNTVPQQTLIMNNGEGKEILIFKKKKRKSTNMFTGKNKLL